MHKMVSIFICLSVICLNSKSLNLTTKRHKLANWIKKYDLPLCCLQETHLSFKNRDNLRVEDQKEVSSSNQTRKQIVSAVLIFTRDFQVKPIKKEKESHFILIKKTINKDGITILNIYVLISGHPISYQNPPQICH